MSGKIVEMVERHNNEKYYAQDSEVISISEHEPQGEGDRHYCDVFFNNGYKVRLFDVVYILYKPVVC